MFQVVVALMGLTIMALLAAPTVKMALMPVYSQKQKNNYTLAEAKAILIRKEVVNDKNNVFFDATDSTSKITQANVASSLSGSGLSTVIDGCTIKDAYNPRQSTASIPKAVECIVGSDQFQAIAWQPLYTSTNLTENAQVNTAAQLTAANMGDAVELCKTSISKAPPTTSTVVCGATITSTNYGGKDKTFSEMVITIKSGSASPKYELKFN